MDPPEEPGLGESSPTGQDTEVVSSSKRRKLRKGTRSCGECKRRKIRCIFTTPGDATCINCQYRHVPCVPQRIAEEPMLVRRDNPRLGERIARVEDFMNALLAQKQSDSSTCTAPVDKGPGVQPSLASPSASRHNSLVLSPHSHSEARQTSSHGRSTTIFSLPTPDSYSAALAQKHTVPCPAEVDTAARRLLEALPAEADVRILLRESSNPSQYTHLINTQPHSRLTLESLAGPYPAAQYPSPGTHPVLLARLLLMFAITLQSPSGEKAPGLSETPEVLMNRLVSAARTWVTTREEMHGSLECLVCIMLEGVYEINCGSLRRAWAAFRRAMIVAQLMGLHCSPLSRLPRLDPTLDLDAKFIWFRIVSMDRHLSLLLGLPQGSSDKAMGDASALQNEPPLGRFERRLAVIACRVLERNETTFTQDQLSITQSIDAELLDVSRNMPVSFWRVPNFYNLKPGSPETLLNTVRLAAHVYYYGLLIQLHLPYMVRVGENPAQEYSIVACVNASREIMARFIAHRTFNPNSSCSRPVDFYALLAGMTLLLAHLDAHRHKDRPSVLAHQRLSDRAMLEQSLDRMDAIKNLNQDPITGKSAELIRRLMEMEADAANGGTYATSSAAGVEQEAANSRGNEDGLYLTIPYLGIIKISRQGPISRELWTENAIHRLQCTSQVDTSASTLVSSSRHSFQETPPHVSIPGDQPICPLSDTPAAAWYDGQSNILPCPGPGIDRTTLLSPADFPPLVANVNNWAFQGVDMAFFDNLMRGATGPEMAN